MPGPIFIIGNPRSGTTLLRLMLTCHPRICIPPECGFAVWLCPKYHPWNAELVEVFAQDVLTCRKIETWTWDTGGLSGFLRAGRPETYGRAVSLVYEWHAHCQGRDGVRWGDKNNSYLDHIATLRTLFPGCALVHVVRDVRSVVCSYRRLSEARLTSLYAPTLPGDIAGAALHWRTNIRTITGAFERLRWQGVHQLRFEDLLMSPQPTLERLCEALGERFDASMLEYHRNRDADLEPPAFSEWKSKVRYPPMIGEARRYELELSDAERQQVEKVAAAELRQCGYLT